MNRAASLSRSRWLTLVSSAVLACAAFFYLRPGSPVAGGASDASPGTQEAQVPETETIPGDLLASVTPDSVDVVARVPPPDAPPLPSPDEPFVEQFERLVEGAQALQGPASCRLARSVLLCAHSSSTTQVTERFIRGMSTSDSQSDALVIDMLARSTDRVERWQAYCEGISEKQLARGRDAVNQAISRLTPSQKVVLSLVRSDGQLRRLNPEQQAPLMDSNIDLFPAFLSGRVRPFLEEGYRARVPLALEGLILLHSPGTTTTRQGIWESAPDQERFLRYALIAQQLFGWEVLGPRVRAVVEAVATSMGAAEANRIAAEAAVEAVAWQADGRQRASMQRGFSATNDELLACD